MHILFLIKCIGKTSDLYVLTAIRIIQIWGYLWVTRHLWSICSAPIPMDKLTVLAVLWPYFACTCRCVIAELGRSCIVCYGQSHCVCVMITVCVSVYVMISGCVCFCVLWWRCVFVHYDYSVFSVCHDKRPVVGLCVLRSQYVLLCVWVSIIQLN